MKTFLILSLFSLSIYSKDIEIKNFWIKEVPPASKVSAGFGEIHNHTGKDIFLKSITGKISNSIEIHTHLKEDGVMKMRKVESLKIPAKSSLMLKPGGDHVMFFDLQSAPKEGEGVELSFDFGDGKKEKVKVKAQVLKSQPKSEDHSGHAHH